MPDYLLQIGLSGYTNQKEEHIVQNVWFWINVGLLLIINQNIPNTPFAIANFSRYRMNLLLRLQKEIERQGFNKYISGDYSLGRLNEQGQRINIRIELERKDGTGSVSFVSGWMVRQNGYITLNTPYGGK